MMTITTMKTKENMTMSSDNGLDAISEPVVPVRPSVVVNSKDVEPEVPNEPQKPSTVEVELRKAEADFVVGEQRVATTTYYGINAVEVKESDPYFAKKTVTSNADGSESVKYSLAIYSGSLYNPAGQYSARNKRVKDFFRFKTCSQECFDNYIEYLKTKKESKYLSANRGILNG